MSRPTSNLQRALPAPYRARALWRGCRWATNIRPWIGREQNGPNCVQDSRSRNIGRFRGGVGVPMVSPQNGGQFVNSNAGSSDLAWEDWQWQAVPQLGIYMWQDTGGMSLACCMQFRTALPGGNKRILTKRFGTAANFHCAALSFAVAGNKWEFSYCDGTNTQSIFSASSPVAGQSYVVIGRHWGNNALSRAELWVNGKMEAVNAAPATYPKYKKDPPLVFFGDTASGDGVGNECAAMGGLWDRPLTTSEIQMLTVNPFVMWGPPAGPEGLPHGGGGGVLDGCKCGGPWLHAWSGLG